MNRWQALQQAIANNPRLPRPAPRTHLGGTYILDWYTSGGLAAPPAPGASPVAPAILPPVMPVPGRNMSEEEAEAADLARRLRPPALVIARAKGASALGPAITPTGQVETVRSPWSETPSGGQPFTQQNVAAVTLPAIGAAATVVTFQVPRRKNGVIEFIANQFVGGGWTEGTGDLIWRITADGVPVQGYDNIIASMGTMANPGWLGTRPIRIYENQVIALVLTNVAVVVAGQPLLGLFRGGFWPIEQEGSNQTFL